MNILQRSSRQAGVTFFEMLIALAILSTLAAIAVPSYQRNTRRSRGASCGVNLRMIESAKKAWIMDHAGETMPTDPLATGGIAQYFFPPNIVPRCPAGGTYTNVTSTTGVCACSLNSIPASSSSGATARAQLNPEDMDIGGPTGWHQNGYHDLGPR